MSNEELIEVSVDIVHETDAAVLVRDADDVEHWIPKSQIHSLTRNGEIEIPEWLAIERGLV